jgi:hypothetical protein
MSGEDFGRLHAALIGAFPKRADFEMMVRQGLDENLNAIVGGTSTSEIAYELIRWAEARERVSDLLAAARRANSTNPALLAFDALFRGTAASLRGAAGSASSGTPSGPRATGNDKRALRAAILANFSQAELNALCADVLQDIKNHGLSIQPDRLDLEIVGGEGLEDKALRLIEYLDRRQLLDFLEQAVRRARPGAI